VGEDDMEDPWEETHSETEQVGGNGAEGTLDPEHHNIGNNEDEGQHGGSNHDEVLEGEEDSEYEDKFHCRPRYQPTRFDVRFIKITFYSIHSSFLKARKKAEYCLKTLSLSSKSALAIRRLSFNIYSARTLAHLIK
jgi:hypothetical protein